MEIKSCPFCGFEDVELDEVDIGCFCVCCPSCSTIGPLSKVSIEDAIKHWNNRSDIDGKRYRWLRDTKRIPPDTHDVMEKALEAG
jgi:hypothetical protein